MFYFSIGFWNKEILNSRLLIIRIWTNCFFDFSVHYDFILSTFQLFSLKIFQHNSGNIHQWFPSAQSVARRNWKCAPLFPLIRTWRPKYTEFLSKARPLITWSFVPFIWYITFRSPKQPPPHDQKLITSPSSVSIQKMDELFKNTPNFWFLSAVSMTTRKCLRSIKYKKMMKGSMMSFYNHRKVLN